MSDPAPPAPPRRLPFVVVAVAATTVALGVGWAAGKLRTGSLAPTASVTQSALGRGELVFQMNCAACHGPEGRGDGPSAAALRPTPKDFTARPWRTAMTREAIRRTILDGLPGTAMPGSREALAPADIDPLVEHVYRLATVRPTAIPDEVAALLRRAGFEPVGDLRTAPPLVVCDTATQHQLTLADLRGRWVLLNFWGTTCTHCRKEFPALERFAQDFDSRGLTVLCICADEADAATAEQIARPSAKGLRLFVDPAGQAATRYEVQVLPTVVLIDAEGRLLGRATGVLDWSKPEVAALFTACLPGTSR